MYFLLNVSIFRLNVSFLHFLAWKASSAGLLKAGLMALLSHNINIFILLTGFHHFLFIYFFMEMMSKDQLCRLFRLFIRLLP